jgi:hypothetical protein
MVRVAFDMRLAASARSQGVVVEAIHSESSGVSTVWRQAAAIERDFYWAFF